MTALYCPVAGSVTEPERVRAVLRQLDQRAFAGGLRARDRARRAEIAGPDRRAVNGRVRELLRHRPVEAARVRPRDD